MEYSVVAVNSANILVLIFRGVYNKAKKLSVSSKMIQDWADWLDSLI